MYSIVSQLLPLLQLLPASKVGEVAKVALSIKDLLYNFSTSFCSSATSGTRKVGFFRSPKVAEVAEVALSIGNVFYSILALRKY